MAALPTFLPLPEAARKYGLDEARIRALVESGTIKAAMIGETIVVQESEVQNSGKPLRKEDLPEWKKHAHLKGVEIGFTESAEKYGIRLSSLQRWFKRGIIAEVKREKGLGGEKIYLDEADVAYCAEIYQNRGGRGKWLFGEGGLPYKPRTGPLSL